MHSHENKPKLQTSASETISHLEFNILLKINAKSKSQNNNWLVQSQISNDILENINLLMQKPFGSCSHNFIQNPELIQFVKNHSAWLEVTLWWLVENFLSFENNSSLQHKALTQLEKELAAVFSLEDRKTISDPNLIRKIYLSKNNTLIHFFMKQLPVPHANLFRGYELPTLILDRECKSTQSILKFLKTNPNIKEAQLIKIQRKMREKLRYKDEIIRINHFYKKYVTACGMPIDSLMKDANTPYFPKGCDTHLANRIVNVAKSVKLFSTIRHIAAAKHLTSMLDDGLYGRRTLENFYMPYKKSALAECDVADGDSNVICFGPQAIDSHIKTNDKVEITLDLNKIQKNNPTIFFKQRDFGFIHEKMRTIFIGKEKLVFSHTGCILNDNQYYTYFRLFNENRCNAPMIASAQLPKFSLISYNFAKIHQILTLNFFRFIDKLCKPSGSILFTAYINKIYSAIAELSDRELSRFLEELGKLMTDTAEFNFYGAHLIESSSIKSIKFNDYSLEINDFISALQAGDLNQLNQAKNNLPQLFKSYRFIDYLLSKITHQEITKDLLSTRKSCMMPFWMTMKHKGIDKTDELTQEQLNFYKM